MKKYSQQGMAHLAILLVLIAAAIIAFVGYEVVKTNRAVAPPSTANYVAPSAAGAIPVINNTAGLNSVENTLNNTNLDQGLDPNNYNQDVNSLL